MGWPQELEEEYWPPPALPMPLPLVKSKAKARGPVRRAEDSPEPNQEGGSAERVGMECDQHSIHHKIDLNSALFSGLLLP